MDIFSKIAAGEIPSYKCAENDEFYAFLDINPLVKGHTLVIPRREVDYFFDMDDDGGSGGAGPGGGPCAYSPHPHAERG